MSEVAWARRQMVTAEVSTDRGLSRAYEDGCPGCIWIKKYEAQDRNQTDKK